MLEELDNFNSQIGVIEDELEEIITYKCSDFNINDSCKNLESNLTTADIAFCMVCSLLSVFITTSEDFEKWLAGIHDFSNGQPGKYKPLQKSIGVLLEHKGDAMDRFETRDGEDVWRLFHRLFYGHDIFGRFDIKDKNRNILQFGDNPFFLMFNQEVDGEKLGVKGVVQAVRHLIADTFSKQGLPMPGSSYFDYTNDNGRPWNHFIDLVQELSKEAYGNKKMAEPIYEHLLTIRAQDIAGGMFSKVGTFAYLKAFNIKDEIRIVQIRLLNSTMSFIGQAIWGMKKQKGIPYINIPLGLEMAKNIGSLLIISKIKTYCLQHKTDNLIKESNTEIERYEFLMQLAEEEIDSLFLGDENVK